MIYGLDNLALPTELGGQMGAVLGYFVEDIVAVFPQ